MGIQTLTNDSKQTSIQFHLLIFHLNITRGFVIYAKINKK